MADESLFVPRTELEARFVALEGRLGKVEKASTDMQAAQETLTSAQVALTATLHANSAKLDDIFAWVTKANGVWGFARRHGPKVGYLLVGIAISRGWITAENGKNFLSVFTG